MNLFDNIKQFLKTLNNLQISGYWNIDDISLKIIDSKADDENDMKKGLEQIITRYKEINKKYKRELKKGYEDYPFLLLFYGNQLIQLHKKVTNKSMDIAHLSNSVALNKIKDINIDFQYHYKVNNIENINKYLIKLFKQNQINMMNFLTIIKN